ncbi:Pol Polyprotein [Phytophthora megakarya]|uniref:Pol Polyprotein n=1 Tax=Phytophthora megakarya TaxID=4795 RepID=A0A225VFU7_9STRA|nr:Pol Polyprotein [Phytophthora megakarya]
MRLALRLLPVRSRSWFLQSQIPDIQQCPIESCTAIETTQHRFLQCARSKTLWNLLRKDWKEFCDSSLCWVSLVLPHKLKITTTWKDHSDVLLVMWNIIRYLTLHHIWTERN